jgi:hypothetical protein
MEGERGWVIDSPLGGEKRKHSRLLDLNRTLIVYNVQEDKLMNNNNNKCNYNLFLTVPSAIISGTKLRNSTSSYTETEGKTILNSVSPSRAYRLLFTYGFPYLTTLSIAHITYTAE